MATSSASGRSRHGSRALRSHRSRAADRHRSSVKADGGEAAVAKPDIDEVRRRRIGYFSVAAADRRRVSTTLAPRPKETPGTATATSTSTVKNNSSSSEHKRRRRKHRSSSDKPERRSESSRTEDYVYGTRRRPEVEKNRDNIHSSSDLSRRSRHSPSSSRRHLAPVIEDEVTPDDSISQLGIQKRSSKSSRSPLKRSSTTPARLPSVREKEVDPKVSLPPSSPRKSSKRDSSTSILGSLWRRNSAKAVAPPPKLVECLTCASDDVPSTKAAKFSCGHRMCHDCLKLVFEMSVKDPAHMPPKCCTNDHIPLKHVDTLFDLKFKKLWNRKYQEYHTKNRIYCPAPKCGEWIKPSHIHTKQGRKYAECPRCTTKVCTLCNGKLHKGKDCPKDPEIAKLVAQAKEKGWQTCHSCHALVELKEGCNHMTCRCTAEFCMVCGSKWKTCDCPWFNYTQLPDADRLQNMRVPEPIQIIYQRVRDATGLGPPLPISPPGLAAAPGIPLPDAQTDRTRREQRQQQQRTYREELDQRRRQEQDDEDLARRLQLASLWEPDDQPRDRNRRRTELDPFGIGNAAGHFMNDDYVQNAANVVMSTFGDANMGRRGERSSGRRRRPREDATNGGAVDAGLATNFLGDESVIGRPPR